MHDALQRGHIGGVGLPRGVVHPAGRNVFLEQGAVGGIDVRRGEGGRGAERHREREEEAGAHGGKEKGESFKLQASRKAERKKEERI